VSLAGTKVNRKESGNVENDGMILEIQLADYQLQFEFRKNKKGKKKYNSLRSSLRLSGLCMKFLYCYFRTMQWVIEVTQMGN